jgi:hypothetical protein
VFRPSVARQPGPQSILDLAVCPLHQTIALRMISCCGDVVDLEVLAQPLPKGGGELPSSATGRGPTRSTCTWLNLFPGTWMGWTGAAGWPVTLALQHCWQSRTQEATSEFIPLHTALAAISRRVARVPACARPWKASKTAFLSTVGTRGRGLPVDVSQSRLAPITSTA